MQGLPHDILTDRVAPAAGRDLASVGSVTARTPSQPVRQADDPGDGPARGVGAHLPDRLRVALAVGVAGGLLLAVGALLPVVSPATPRGFASGPLLFVLGLLPIAVAVTFAVRGSASAAGGALVAAALFAPGRALADAQLAVEGGTADRPEFALPSSLQHLHGGAGLWLILAGHVAALVAGVLVVGQGDGGDLAGSSERRPGSYQGPVLVALGLGAVAAVGLVAEPFTSATPFLLAKGVLDSPLLALIGGLLIAIAVPLGATIAVTSADPAVAKGCLLGSGAVVLAVALPKLVSGLVVSGLGPAWGPYGAVAAAVGLIVFAFVTDRTVATADDHDDAGEPADLNLPGQSRLHLATGIAGVLAAGAALVAADTNLFVLPPDLPATTDVSGRPLIPAAIVLAVCSILVLVPRWAALARPAFAVAWVGMLLAGTQAFDTALTATEISQVTVGPAFWASGLAMLAALAGGCCAGLAGGVEREDVDLSEVTWQPMVMAPGAAAAALAFGAFGLPLFQAPGYTPPGIWSTPAFASWGLGIALVAVIAAALLAPFCRPARGAALLLGAVGIVVVRLLTLPLTMSEAPHATTGPGFLLAAACLVALLVGAALAGVATRHR